MNLSKRFWWITAALTWIAFWGVVKLGETGSYVEALKEVVMLTLFGTGGWLIGYWSRRRQDKD